MKQISVWGIPNTAFNIILKYDLRLFISAFIADRLIYGRFKPGYVLF